MKKLLLTAAAVAVIAGTAFACSDHAKAVSDALIAGKALSEAVVIKDLKEGERIGCSKKGADNKFTRIYNSAAGAVANEVLSGSAETNTAMMFKAVDGKKLGEVVDVSFESEKDGVKVSMKASVMSAGNDTVCAVMWPAEAPKEVAKVEAKKEEAKPVAPAVAPVPAVVPAEVKKDAAPVVPAAPAAK